MKITLYNNSSAYNTLYKSLEQVEEVTGDIKGTCSIDNPTLIIDYPGTDFNYLYIPLWNRYYTVTNRQASTGQRMIISAQSDPLQSFAAGIAARKALAVRNEDISKWDKDVADPYMITKSKREYHGYSFGSMQTVHSSGDATYVLGVI